MATRLDWSSDFDAQAARLGDRALSYVASDVAESQRRRIPVSRDGSYGRPAGWARSHIAVWRGVDALGWYRDIGSDATTPDGTSYPAILDLGSAPHTIESHGDYPLRDKHGRVFGRRVQHPGTKPTAWCRGSLEDVRGRVYWI